MPEHPDLVRLRNEYADRVIQFAGSNIYSFFNPAYLFMIQQRQRSLLRSLSNSGINKLSDKKILEVGCGNGRALVEYLLLGAQAKNTFGIDLLVDRVRQAQQILPGSGIGCADGQNLPFPNQYFDLILQYTAFSSILNEQIRALMATEMLRTMRNDGIIVWYDFWINPTNPHTKGIRPAEIRSLFPNCSYEFHKITLAPPISRQVAQFSWILVQLMESIKIFNSHYLVLIKKKI
jgi:ubiquinone/menaquinone biosynthesis C-methylase UbiE